jgi:hypothetical protein
MPIRRVPQLTAFSYSRLSDYEECPRRAKFKHIEKLKEPTGPALERGKAIHSEAERYVRGLLPTLPPSLARFPDEFAALLKIGKSVAVEQQLAVNARWQQCDWFGSDAWLRVVVDAYYREQAADGGPDRIVMIDYKTGRVYPDKVDQLDLYGLVALALNPDVERIESAFWYLDAGEILDQVLLRSEAEPVRKRWVKRVAPLLADTTFAPTPGDGCRWCHFGMSGKAKGGPGLCEY